MVTLTAAFVGGILVTSTVSAHDAPEGEHTEPLLADGPSREADGVLEGDLWILELTDAASAAWDKVTVETSSNGTRGSAIVDRGSGVLVDLGGASYLERDGLRVELLEAVDEAQIIFRSLDVAATKDRAAAEVSARIAAGEYSSRLPVESPTRWDSLDLALAPSYWNRSMIRRLATSIDVVGEGIVAGRLAHIVSIAFDEPASEKYGDQGWTWWVDQEVGILLKYELGSPTGEPFTFEITNIEFNAELPDTLLIPSGFTVNVVVVTEEGIASVSRESSVGGLDPREAIAEFTRDMPTMGG